MTDAFALVLRVHIVAAVLATVTFWIPIAARKGGRLHVRSGKLYLLLLLVTVVTALALTGLSFVYEDRARPAGTGMPLDVVERDRAAYRLLLSLLAALGVVTLTAAISGMRALKLGRTTRGVEAAWHGVLAVVGVSLAGGGVSQGHLPAIVVGLAFAAASAFGFAAARRTAPAARLPDHACGLVISGIGLHSTVAVVLANRLVPDFFHGPLGVVVWALPTLIGVPFLFLLRRL
ncbi:MAG: hypothetical protein ACF8XB_24435 [Planctomycetota bacterium JB042]